MSTLRSPREVMPRVVTTWVGLNKAYKRLSKAKVLYHLSYM